MENYVERITNKLTEQGLPAFQLASVESRLKKLHALQERKKTLPQEDSLKTIHEHLNFSVLKPEHAADMAKIAIDHLEADIPPQAVQNTVQFLIRNSGPSGFSIEQVNNIAERLRELQKLIPDAMVASLEATMRHDDLSAHRFITLISYAHAIAKAGKHPLDALKEVNTGENRCKTADEVETALREKVTQLNKPTYTWTMNDRVHPVHFVNVEKRRMSIEPTSDNNPYSRISLDSDGSEPEVKIEHVDGDNYVSIYKPTGELIADGISLREANQRHGQTMQRFKDTALDWVENHQHTNATTKKLLVETVKTHLQVQRV